MSADTGTPTRPKRKKIDLVALYEAVQQSNDPANFIQPQNEADKTPVDTFNPQAFLSNVLRTQSLKELLETDSGMLKEIKDLENNMKALVYANYSKFITASSTIHQMRGKMDNIEDEMKKLKESVEKISTVSDKISGTLQSKREQIEQLSGVHHLLQKLQFLVDLPMRLKASIATRNYEEAVTYWRKTRTVLEKYKHFSSFTPIEKQCSEIIADLTKTLSTTYFANNVQMQTLYDYAALLLNLDQPVPQVRMHFVQIRIEQLKALFVEYQSAPLLPPVQPNPAQANAKQDPNAPPPKSPEAEAAFASIEKFNKAVMSPINQFINIYCDLFVSRKNIIPEDQLAAIFLLDKAIATLVASYTSVITKYLLKVTVVPSANSEAQSQDGSSSPSSEVLRGASDGLDNLLGSYWSAVLLPTTTPTNLTKIKTKSSVGDTSKYINDFITSLLDSSFEDIQADIIKIIGSGLERVSASIAEYLSPSRPHSPIPSPAPSPAPDAPADLNASTTDANTKEAIDSITSSIVSSLDASFGAKLSVLFSLCSPGSFLENSAASLLTSVQTKIQSLLQQIVEQFGGTDAARTNVASTRLLVAPLVFDALKNKALPVLAATLGRIVSQTKHSNLSSDVAQNKIVDFGSELTAASQKLIAKHVRETGVRLGEMFRRIIETPDWLKRPEPSGIDSAIEMVAEELVRLQRPIAVLYEEGTRKERKRLLLGSVSGPDNKVAVTSDVEFDQLFQKKVNYFDKVEFNCRAIATATIKIALKTYLESVRLQTYSTNGYQQLQLDIHYLNLVLDQHVSDPASLDAMMMDILNSAKERCPQPYSMDLPIVAKLCSEAFAKHQAKYANSS